MQVATGLKEKNLFTVQPTALKDSSKSPQFFFKVEYAPENFIPRRVTIDYELWY